MKRILLLGSQGQVGQELLPLLSPLGEAIALSREQVDLADSQALKDYLETVRADWIVNAAAYTAVDRAEQEPDLAYAVNATAPKIMAEVATATDALLFHISTDYVFDGQKSSPYTETDATNPLGVYGQSKQAGEANVRAHCQHYAILRTAWVYGVGGRGNFVKTMMRLGAEREELRVVSDQIGTPTWTRDIAEAIAALLPQLAADRDLSGIYHFTNSGVASWYDLSVTIFEEARHLGVPLKVARVAPITTPEYPAPARRPAYSVLAGKKIAGVLDRYPPHWRHSLRQMLRALTTAKSV